MTILAAIFSLFTWIAPIDSRTGGEWVAEAPGRVYALRDHRVVAIDRSSGKTVWQSTHAFDSAPVALRGLIAVVQGDDLVFLDDAGKERKRIAHAHVFALAATSGTIAALSNVKPGVALTTYDAATRVRVHERINARGGERLYALGGNALGIMVERNMLVLDAMDGKAVAMATNVDELVGADGRYLWFTVINGGLKGLDLWTDRSVALHGSIIRDAVRVEHHRAVAVIDGRLQTIDLAANATSAPLKIVGRWVGGPLNGQIFTERSDGMYMQALTPNSKAVRIARYGGDSRIVTSDRRVAFIGLADGTVFVIDTQTRKQLAKISTPCRIYEGFTASGKTSIVHCDSDKTRSQLVGFQRFLF